MKGKGVSSWYCHILQRSGAAIDNNITLPRTDPEPDVFNHRDTEARRGRLLPNPEKSELARRRGDRGENLFSFSLRRDLRASPRENQSRENSAENFGENAQASDLHYREAIYSGGLRRVA